MSEPKHTPGPCSCKCATCGSQFAIVCATCSRMRDSRATLLAAAEAALDRLEAWGERHAYLARTIQEGPLCDQHRNQAANYGALAADLRAAIAKAKGGR